MIKVDAKLECSQQSCGSGALADGRLADLIRRVSTFGMVLMKLDLRQVCEFIMFWSVCCNFVTFCS